jgi:epoxide hydrolase-like predicted phosphatase
MLLMIKAVIFDFFGVIIGDGFDITYRTAGGDPVKDKEFILELLSQTNRGEITTDEFRNMLCKQLGITVEEYQLSLEKSEVVNYELLDYIKTLRPKYKTAILSNANVGSLERRVERKMLNECFDDLVVSAEVGFIKPEPEIYKLAAERLGVKVDECVFVDDREGYVNGATKVGMFAILYEDFPSFKKELEKLLSSSSDK